MAPASRDGLRSNPNGQVVRGAAQVNPREVRSLESMYGANDGGWHNCPPAIGLAGDRGLTLRQGQERRHGDRRSCDRGQPDRRRRERRRNRIRSLIFTALAFALPQSFKYASVHLSPRASVSTWVDSVTPITARQAYERAIQDAADLYHLEPALIRSVI